MQSTPPSSAGSGSSPGRSGLGTKRRSVVALRSPSDRSSSPLRVVHAEGSDFVLEPLPTRSGISASRLSSSTRHVSAPHSSSSTASTSSSPRRTAPHSSPHSRAVSSSLTPPRSRQTERPYRPPPSSSARFYERQQQIWLLQQPSLLPPMPTAHVSSPSAHLPIAHHAAPASALPPLQPTSPPYALAQDREQIALSVRSRSSSISSAASRSRATSVSSLALPDASGFKNRARSGSEAGSFTRSRISNGYLSHTDDDSVDHDPIQAPSTIAPRHTSLRSSIEVAVHSSPAYRPVAATTISDSSPLAQSVRAPPKSPARDSLRGSIDADWDAELGISEADHAEPLRLPLTLQQTEQVLHPSPTIADASSAPGQDLYSTKIVVSGASSASTPVSASSHLHSIQAADLKGIRVTSSVSESWDDDFLFQNEEETAASTSPSSGRTPRTFSGGRSDNDKQKRNSLHDRRDDDDEDEDVENWDDAFSWNGDPHMTPSASNTSSLHNSVRVSNIPLAGSHAGSPYETASSSRKLAAGVRRHLDFGGEMAGLDSKKRLSNSSTASGATDFSARLAAQFEASSDRQRTSFDSDGFTAPGLYAPAGKRNALGLAETSIRSRPSTGGRSEADGDDTETETPSKWPLPSTKSRPARRSLGAALGFDTSRSSTAGEAAASPSLHVGRKDKDASAAPADNSHKRTKSKLGALQRLSFSRSRANVANASTTSVNEMGSPEESPRSPLGIYADGANKSQASLLSQMSNSSHRSRRGASPSSLEKSYAALRSTSFRRLLGRGGPSNTASPSARATPPSSPPRRTSELAQPLDAFCSPAREGPPLQTPKQSMSPPSAWLGLRRSSEATPTRSKERNDRRGSANVHCDSEEVSWAIPNSLSKPSGSMEDRAQHDALSMPPLQTRLEKWNSGEDTSRRKDVSGLSSGRGFPATSNLRRDFSSSNTLRAAMAYDEEDTSIPTYHCHNASRTETSTRTLQPSDRKIHSRIASDEATADDPTSAQYPYLGQRMQRGSDDNTYASRSVSASTAHSHTSTDSLTGYRMRKQISTSSTQDAQDSETSYGTSVGSSPGLSNPSSSGWLSHGKRGATSSFDTKDTAWSSAITSSAHHGSLRDHSDQHSRATSMPGSPINLEKTLEGTPVTAPRTERMLSAPDTSLSPPRQPHQGNSSCAESPMTPSRGVHLHAIGSSQIKPPSTAADTSAPVLSSADIAVSASPQRSATRRNSLSDLKIPSRISKAQSGLRNNISLVRDFAKGIEELKMLKASYLDHKMRASLSSSDVEERMQNWLECADVLIGLGEGRSEADSAARVDTVSHTPLATRVDSRRTTFSDVSSYAPPRSPMNGPVSRQSSISGARSTSGTSQATTSTTDGVRSVDAQREIDILSAILGPTSRVESRSHGRFQSETYSRDDVLHRNAEFLKAPHRAAATGSSADTDIQWSNLTTPSRVSFDEKQGAKFSRNKKSDRAFNTAPVSAGLNGELPSLEGVDVGDANRSAKRRLRSASRAGLQGLRELLKVFKGAEATSTGAATKATDSSPRREEESRASVDVSNSSTPAKQKRKSLNLKRRSFLRSKTSLDNLQAKGNEVTQEATPPMPGAAGKKQASPGKTSLDTTREASTMADARQQAKDVRAGRRISLQSALSGKRRSIDGAISSENVQRVAQSIDSRMKADGERPNRRTSLAPVPAPPAPSTSQKNAGEESKTASTSIDTTYHRPAQPGRSQSSLEPANQQTSGTVQKLALRPEAMPGLLVYVQATRQHLIAAIEELGPNAT